MTMPRTFSAACLTVLMALVGSCAGHPGLTKSPTAEMPAKPTQKPDDREAPARGPFSRTVYVHGDWRLTEMYDCMPPHNYRREQSHVLIEYQGETVYLKQGLGYRLWFADAEDFIAHGCNGKAPARAGEPVWHDAQGRPTHLELERLSGNGSITLALLDAGERYVWRRIHFLELAADGKPDEHGQVVRELLACESFLELPSAERVDGDVHFKLPDGGWFGWDSHWNAATPVITLSLRGGPRVCNGPMADEHKATRERWLAEMDPVGNWSHHLVRNTILQYLYHGHVDEARSVLKRHVGMLYDAYAPEGDAEQRVAWFWDSIVERFLFDEPFRRPLLRLLQDEFPQLKRDALRAVK